MWQHIQGIFNETVDLWIEMGIYLVFGFAIAGILSRVLRREWIARHLGHSNLASVTKASIFGIPLPLCSCGVLPVGLSLRARGAGKPATTSFLISTPQTGVDSIAITWAFLGPVFAFLRPVAALVSGVLGGWSVAIFERRDEAARTANGDSCATGEDCESCTPEDEERGVGLWRHIERAFFYGFLEFPREIVKWLVIGIVAAGVISYVLPDEHEILHDTLGSGFVPMLVMAVVGIPLYICSTASVPVVGVLVLKGGLSAGAALVFLMTGPATNVATLLLISRQLGKRTAICYLGAIVLTSFAGGWLLDIGYRAADTTLKVQAEEHFHKEVWPEWFTLTGAWVLLAIVLVGLGRQMWGRFARKPETEVGETQMGFDVKVNGMTCQHCVGNVEKAATGVSGVEAAAVDLKAGQVKITGDPVVAPQVVAAINDAGYEASAM